MAWVRKALRLIDARDVIWVTGFVSALYGIACWSVPAAYLAGGIVLMAVAIGPILRKAKS